MLLHKNHTYHALLLLFACFLGSSAWAQAGFDPRIPDGIVKPKSYRISLQGKGNTFTVPEGRNLYITRLTVSPSSVMSDTGFLTIDGMPVMSFNKGLDLCGIGLDQYLATPLLVGEGSKLAVEGHGELHLQVLTVEAKVPVVIFKANEPMKIPEGKTFVLMHTIRERTCDVAYKGTFTFGEIDALHFPEFFDDLSEIKTEADNRIRLGYLY